MSPGSVPVDLGPAAETLAELVESVPAGALDRPTPSGDYSVGDLVDHIGTLAVAFADAATKTAGEYAAAAPQGSAAHLGPDWRSSIPRDVRALAVAWRDPAAWAGMTAAGGFDLPGEVAGVVALDEVVLHGWDLARALGRPYPSDPASLDVVLGFVTQSAAEGGGDGLFGPPVAVPDDAPLLDRIVGLAGRDPAWSGPASAG
jgi:uncharacterized protein (TIGR03086 family)